MVRWNNEQDARNEIKDLVSEYYHSYMERKEPYKKGDRISYSGRVFDDSEMRSLTDALLDFWLTSGRFVNYFE